MVTGNGRAHTQEGKAAPLHSCTRAGMHTDDHEAITCHDSDRDGT